MDEPLNEEKPDRLMADVMGRYGSNPPGKIWMDQELYRAFIDVLSSEDGTSRDDPPADSEP